MPSIVASAMSPGFRGIQRDTYSITVGIDWIIWRVFAFCITSPFRRISMSRFIGSGISSAVTSHGPVAPVCSKFLPGTIWLLCRWYSRRQASLMHE